MCTAASPFDGVALLGMHQLSSRCVQQKVHRVFVVACLQIGNALINLLIKSTTIRVPNPNWDPANPEAAPRQIEKKAFWHEVSTVVAFPTVCVAY